MTATRAERLERLHAARVYLCTDARQEQGDLVDFVTAAVEGGVGIVQLREKGLEARDELALLEQLCGILEPAGTLLAVNDRADIARHAGADILHLGQRDLTPAHARELVGTDMLIGQSTHDEEQGTAAESDDDVDYYCVGPVWETPTKPGRQPTGLGALRAAAERVGKPWFAIGGIDSAERLEDAVAAGAERVVVVRAITLADDPAAAARLLRSRLPA